MGWGFKPGQVTLAVGSNPPLPDLLYYLSDVCVGHVRVPLCVCEFACAVFVLLTHYIIIRPIVGDLTVNPESVEMEMEIKNEASVVPGFLLAQGWQHPAVSCN